MPVTALYCQIPHYGNFIKPSLPEEIKAAKKVASTDSHPKTAGPSKVAVVKPSRSISQHGSDGDNNKVAVKSPAAIGTNEKTPGRKRPSESLRVSHSPSSKRAKRSNELS